MIRIYIYISCCILVVFAQGCKDSQQEDGGLVEIEKSKLTDIEPQEFNSLYEEVRIVPLETTADLLFADVVQTISTESYIYVRSRFSASTTNAGVWQFDTNGKLVGQLGTVGEGPGEYHSIGDMVLRNDTLFAFDNWNRNVHLYDANTGAYLYSTTPQEYEPLISVNTVLPIPGSDNFLMNSDVIFGDNTYAVAEGNPITGYFKPVVPQKFKVSNWASYSIGEPTLASFNTDKALAILPLNDTIYSVDYATLQVAPYAMLKIDVQAPEFADGEEYEIAVDRAKELKYTNVMSGIYASKDYLLINRTFGSVVWSLSQRKGWYTLNGYKPYEVTALPFFPTHVVESHEDNTFVCSYDAETFEEAILSNLNGPKVKLPEGGLGDFDAESNDVLVFYKFK